MGGKQKSAEGAKRFELETIPVTKESFPSLDDAVKMKPCGYTRAYRQYQVDQIREICQRVQGPDIENSINDNLRRHRADELDILKKGGFNLLWCEAFNNHSPSYVRNVNMGGGRKGFHRKEKVPCA